jgi:hypothetical protein
MILGLADHDRVIDGAILPVLTAPSIQI